MTMNIEFRRAENEDVLAIWEILQQGILRRRADGSEQWQDGYPNPDVIRKDIDKRVGFVLMVDGDLAGYVAIMINDEPAYQEIEGSWLTDNDFVVYHRVAISDQHLGKGLAVSLLEKVESFARKEGIISLRADTNHDNSAMLHLFNKLGYTYCGEVYFRGSARRAYEKVIEL